MLHRTDKNTVKVAANIRDTAVNGVPKMPPSVMRLVAKLAHFDVDFREISQIIERDPVLCGQILGVVNSAESARRNTISKISDAVIMLGMSRLRKIALGLTVTKLFSRVKLASGWSPLRFNTHSVAVASMTEILADFVPVPNADSAFVAGLLHDTGKLAIAANLQDQYETILRLWSCSGRPICECEEEILDCDHAEISGLILARWELPIFLQRAVYDHHHPREGDLSWLIQQADEFVRYLGITVEPPDTRSLPEFNFHVPGVELPQAEVLRRFRIEFDQLSKMFA
ncbi:MAG TPA: HDOD domain-containing protein [Bryobacteraceae bacterium]|nr:HDOD domain-containing protein [Bryobacteraceae bacterium]